MTMHEPHRLSELVADWEAEQRTRWQAEGTSLTFDAWKQEQRTKELREEDARIQAGIRAQRRQDALARLGQQIPLRYRDVTVTDPQVRKWCDNLLSDSDATQRVHGPSLLILGPTGVGKTHEAFGALRHLAESGLPNSIEVIIAADLYAKLRPRPGVDSEAEFERFAKSGLLFVDDIGAAKSSEWVEEINYRLVNHRWNNELPTVFTSNVPPKELAVILGERVASRVTGMSATAVLKGTDRRRAAA
jgi:DNA replication protein DnaC